MTNIPVSVQLDLAADAIEMAGWTQGSGGWPGYGKDSGLCLEGGIMAAIGTTDFTETLWACPAYRAVADYLDHDITLEVRSGGFARLPREPLWKFNDAADRTQQEVIEVLRGAAAVERVKEATLLGYEDEDQPLPLEVTA